MLAQPLSASATTVTAAASVVMDLFMWDSSKVLWKMACVPTCWTCRVGDTNQTGQFDIES
jgi:hypothetical protein